MTLCLLNSSLSLPMSQSPLYLSLLLFPPYFHLFPFFLYIVCCFPTWTPIFMILEIMFINFLHVWLSRKMRLAPITNLITSQKKNFDSLLNDYVWYTPNYMLTHVWMLLNRNLLFSVSWLMVCVCMLSLLVMSDSLWPHGV